MFTLNFTIHKSHAFDGIDSKGNITTGRTKNAAKITKVINGDKQSFKIWHNKPFYVKIYDSMGRITKTLVCDFN